MLKLINKYITLLEYADMQIRYCLVMKRWFMEIMN